MKISKKRLANKVRKLEVQNYDMRQKIKKMDKALTYLDELTTELNHALPDPEYDAQCEENAIAVGESLARHAVRLGLVKPKLKQLDQSVFDGLDEKWQWAVVKHDGVAVMCDARPTLDYTQWFLPLSLNVCAIGNGYDTTDWQNSLTERDKVEVELTGSDLCKAMLARGDLMVPVWSGKSDDNARLSAQDESAIDPAINIISSFDNGYFYDVWGSGYKGAVPISLSTGLELTAAEVGL